MHVQTKTGVVGKIEITKYSHSTRIQETVITCIFKRCNTLPFLWPGNYLFRDKVTTIQLQLWLIRIRLTHYKFTIFMTINQTAPDIDITPCHFSYSSCFRELYEKLASRNYCQTSVLSFTNGGILSGCQSLLALHLSGTPRGFILSRIFIIINSLFVHCTLNTATLLYRCMWVSLYIEFEFTNLTLDISV